MARVVSLQSGCGGETNVGRNECGAISTGPVPATNTVDVVT